MDDKEIKELFHTISEYTPNPERLNYVINKYKDNEIIEVMENKFDKFDDDGFQSMTALAEDAINKLLKENQIERNQNFRFLFDNKILSKFFKSYDQLSNRKKHDMLTTIGRCGYRNRLGEMEKKLEDEINTNPHITETIINEMKWLGKTVKRKNNFKHKKTK